MFAEATIRTQPLEQLPVAGHSKFASTVTRVAGLHHAQMSVDVEVSAGVEGEGFMLGLSTAIWPVAKPFRQETEG